MRSYNKTKVGPSSEGRIIELCTPVLTHHVWVTIAAKQEAFEESIRLKNQFRALDDDEVEFLESVLESSKAKENAVKQETAEQLEAFRKQRALAEQALLDTSTADQKDKSSIPVDKTAWTMQKKKRRRDKDNEPQSEPKSRKLSASAPEEPQSKQKSASESSEGLEVLSSTKVDDKPKVSSATAANERHQATPVGLGLADYTSDEDD